MKTQLGSECPVFSTSCPFKNLTSSGSPLVSELEYRTWSMFTNEDLLEERNKEQIELSKHLKTGTKKSHRAAESVHFVKNFIRGKIDRDIYKYMVCIYRPLTKLSLSSLYIFSLVFKRTTHTFFIMCQMICCVSRWLHCGIHTVRWRRSCGSMPNTLCTEHFISRQNWNVPRLSKQI